MLLLAGEHALTNREVGQCCPPRPSSSSPAGGIPGSHELIDDLASSVSFGSCCSAFLLACICFLCFYAFIPHLL